VGSPKQQLKPLRPALTWWSIRSLRLEGDSDDLPNMESHVYWSN